MVAPLESESSRHHSTFMLLWNPDYFPWSEEDRLETLASIEAGEPAEDQWSMSANVRNVQAGDRLFLRKTGKGERGIVAAGWVQGEVIAQPHWDGSARAANYVPLSWDSLVDFDNPLSLESISKQFPSGVWKGMQSGMRISADAAEVLEHQWIRHFEGDFHQELHRDDGQIATAGIERRYAASIVRARRHQRSFRALLLRNREPVCEFGDCTISDLRLLEAAHIVPDAEGGESSLENGLLLCRNHHRALDVHLLEYDGDEFYWNADIEPF